MHVVVPYRILAHCVTFLGLLLAQDYNRDSGI